MLFFDGIFLVFFAVLAVALLAARGVRSRSWVFIVASYLFYAAWDWRFTFLLFGCTAFDWWIASRMPAAEPAARKRLLVFSMASNLGVLAIFKYLDFGLSLVGLSPLGIILPVGISFFTFQSMSYTIDVYRGQLKPCRFEELLHFVSFFPHLVAGPIIRAADFLPQVQTALRSFPHDVARAVPLFVLGMFKKTVVADNLALIADKVFANPAAFSPRARAEATLAFAGQIYCDFSGYTDMALAMFLLFGFTFPPNFRSPYLSRGPQEFWRRWHISLSTWLREYLYKPLGGSQHGVRRMYFALIMTMLLGGLWHGASWTFVVWGLFHGILLVIERLIRDRIPEVVRRSLTPLTWMVFFALTLVGWIIFRADTLPHLRGMLSGIYWPTGKSVATGMLWFGWAFIAVEHVAGEILRRREGRPLAWPYITFAVAGLMLAAGLLLRPVQNIPFIYFQF